MCRVWQRITAKATPGIHITQLIYLIRSLFKLWKAEFLNWEKETHSNKLPAQTAPEKAKPDQSESKRSRQCLLLINKIILEVSGFLNCFTFINTVSTQGFVSGPASPPSAKEQEQAR